MSYPESKERALSEQEKEEIRDKVLENNPSSGHLADEYECSPSQIAGIKADLSRRHDLDSVKIIEEQDILASIISKYTEFYKSSRHRNEEYKWENVREFQEAWEEAEDKSGDEFYEVLKPVFQETNLLGWGKNKLQKKFNDDPEEASEVVKNLLDEEQDIYERISEFKSFFDMPNAGGTKVASYFLSSRHPGKYIYFKFTEDQEFVEDLGLELDKEWKEYEDRIQRYLDFNERMKEVLEKINLDDKDLWNVQDLIWFYAQYWLPEDLKSELDEIKSRAGEAYTRLFALKCFFETQEEGNISGEEFDEVVREKAEKEDLPGENKSAYIQLNYNVFRNYEPFTASDDEYGVKEEYQEYLSAMEYYVDYLWSEVTSERSYYLISHNEYPEGLDEGFLKAPYTESSSDYDGRYQPSHDLSRLEVGDKLLHYRAGEFKGYSEIEEEPEVRTNNEGEKEFYVEVDIQKFDEPRRLGSVRQVLEEDKEKVDRYYALDEKGGKAEGYLKVLTERGFKHVVNMEDPQPGIEVDEKLSADLNLDFGDLYFPEDEEKFIKSQIKASLNSGKHIIFTGPPGTGKTELAEKVADEMESEDDNVTGFQLTTATSDWSTFDTVGGYRPKNGEEGLEFKPGHILRRFKDDEKDLKNEALVIDEINRADIDKAFGQLFTVLSSQKVQLPFTKGDAEKEVEVVPGNEFEKPVEDHEFVVPDSWRILATMNTYDKTSLYEMSYAFMRRFSFIRIEAPEIPEDEKERNQLMDKYIQAWDLSVGPGPADAVGEIWYCVNNAVEGREIGPAIAKDMLEFLNESGSNKASNTAAITNFIFPQLEGVPERKEIVESLADVSDNGDIDLDDQRLERVANNMLGVDISGEE